MIVRVRYCARGGLLVGSDPIGPTPHDFDWRPSHLIIGCNNLCCTACNAAVANVLTGMRAYHCSCTRLEVATPLRVNDPEDGPLSWVCAGHAPLALPTVLDGIALTSESLASVADLILDGQRFATPELAGFWLARLHALLPDPPTGLPSPERATLEGSVSAPLRDELSRVDFASLTAWTFARHRPSTSTAATATALVERALRYGQPVPPRAEQAVFERADAGHADAREVLWALALLGLASPAALALIHDVMAPRIHGAPAHLAARLRLAALD